MKIRYENLNELLTIVAKVIYSEVVEDGEQYYRKLILEGDTLDSDKREYEWIEIMKFMSDSQKESLLRMIRQIIIDTVASVGGILNGDGYSGFDDLGIDLIIDGNSTEGCLTDAFLEYVEDLAKKEQAAPGAM